MPYYSYFFPLLLLLALPAQAQEVGTCAPATADAYLNINNVRARVPNNGGLFWNGSPHVYEVPRGGGVNALFAGALWVGGLVEGEVRAAGTTYGPYTFWPGPIDMAGRAPSDCSPYDQIYTLTRSEIDHYERTGEASPALTGWPAHLGAPVIDGDGIEGNYDLAAGDRPKILGHQALWWVMNDLGNTHERFESLPIGLEVRVLAFAAADDDPAIDNTTFYRYTLTHRGPAPFEDAYLGLFMDGDLGNFDDDYVGTDTTRHLGFFYNADNDDDVRQAGGYGEAPPAIGITFLDTPVGNADGRDNDRDGQVDEPGERLGLSHTMYWNGGGGVTGDPATKEDLYNLLRARWRDGQHFTEGGNGRDFSTTPTNYFFPGDPVTRSFWSELNSDGNGTAIAPADRRFALSAGPLTLQPGETTTLTLAVVWARGADHLDAVAELRAATDAVRARWEAGFPVATVEPLPASAIPAQVMPGHEATGQPTNTTFRWTATDGIPEYEFHLARDSTFTSGFVATFVQGQNTLQVDTLRQDQTYYWQVRARDGARFSPWSDVQAFTTGRITLSTPGPLLIDPLTNPTSYAWVEVAGPGGSDPCSPSAISTYGCLEVGGNYVWASFNSTQDYFVSSIGTGPESTFVFFAPNDYEIRFTAEGAFGYNITSEGRVLHVPFEVWDIGNVGPFNDNDPSDDVQLIPVLFSDGSGECAFAIGETVDPWSNTIASDRVAAYYPRVDYDDWSASVGPLVEAEGCTVLPESERERIDWDRGAPLVNLVLADAFPDEGRPLPGEGTVIRFYSTPFGGVQPPVPAAPATTRSVRPGAVDFWWQGHLNAVTHTFELAEDLAFTSLLATATTDTPTHRAVLDEGTYYWRVRSLDEHGRVSDWSEVWTLTVAEPVPPTTVFTLDGNYPNPFTGDTWIAYTLSEAGPATLRVYDVLGREVATLLAGAQPPGAGVVMWRPEGLASGVYFYRLEANGRVETRSLTYVK